MKSKQGQTFFLFLIFLFVCASNFDKLFISLRSILWKFPSHKRRRRVRENFIIKLFDAFSLSSASSSRFSLNHSSRKSVKAFDNEIRNHTKVSAPSLIIIIEWEWTKKKRKQKKKSTKYSWAKNLSFPNLDPRARRHCLLSTTFRYISYVESEKLTDVKSLQVITQSNWSFERNWAKGVRDK